MDEAAEKAVIKERVRAISKGSGLQRRALAASLGKGLCLLWGFNPEATDLETRREIARRFDRMIRMSPDESDDSWVVRSGLLSFNISTLTKGEHFSYSARRQFLDRPWRKKEGRPEPDVGYRSKGSVITATEKVYAHIAGVILAEWRQTFPNEPFPRDLPPQTADDTLEDEAGLDAFDTDEGLSGQEPPPRAEIGETPGVPADRRGPRIVRLPWRARKRLLVFGSCVAVAALFISLTVWLAPGGQSPSNKAVNTPASASVVSSPYLTATATAEFGGDGYSVVFPDAATAKPFVAQNRSGGTGGVGNGITNVFDRELSAGAYAAGSEKLNVSLRNTSASELDITNVELANFKHEPIPLGAMFENPGEQNEAGSVGFVLDRTGAVPLTYDAGTDTFGSSYFRNRPSIPVQPGTPTSLRINFLAQAGAYSFSIVLDYTVNGTHEHAYVTSEDGSKPLVVRVSATLCSKLPASVPAAEQQQFEQGQYQSAYHVIDDMNAGLELIATDPKQFVANGCE